MDSKLEQMRKFIQSYDEEDILAQLSIDYTDSVPNCAGLFPEGLVEINRKTFITGDVTVTNQVNFALYTMLDKSPGDDTGATYNADWLMGFQEWVQEQSVMGKAPVFGDEPRLEKMVAQNGAIYQADEEGFAVYAIRISAVFVKNYRKD